MSDLGNFLLGDRREDSASFEQQLLRTEAFLRGATDDADVVTQHERVEAGVLLKADDIG